MMQRIRRVARIKPVEEVVDDTPPTSCRFLRVTPYKHPRPAPSARESTPKLSRGSAVKIKALRGSGAGRRLVIVASGPSVARVDFSQVKDREDTDFLFVNRPLPILLDIAKYWAVNDQPIVMQHLAEMRQFKGEIICGSSAFVPGRDCIKVTSAPGRGFSMDLERGFHLGRSTTLSSLQVAVWCGYESIVVCGCDMNADGQLYFTGETNPVVSDNIRRRRFDLEAENWAYAAESLPEEIRRRITFVTDLNPYPFIQQFRHTDNLVLAV